MNHILVTPAAHKTPWWPTTKRHRESWGQRLWTDCCGCKMPARETDCQFTSYFDYPLGGMGGEWEWGADWITFDYPTGAYFDGDWRFRCAEGFGCTVKPSRKNGRDLREGMWRYGE